MKDTTDWAALRSEREALVEEILALPTPLAWNRVRAAFAEREDRHSPPTIYWLPPRSFLLPLALELLRPFIERHGPPALDCLAAHATDSDPAVAAYSLLGLSRAADPRLPELVESVATRDEKLRLCGGCFVNSGTLAHVARKFLREDHGRYA
jgi:hypothetical protein